MSCKIIFNEPEGSWQRIRYWHSYAGQDLYRISSVTYNWFVTTGLLEGEQLKREIVTNPEDKDIDKMEWSLFGFDDNDEIILPDMSKAL
jgi:hypothetical protein